MQPKYEADSDETFSSLYFLKEPNETVESIEARLKEINAERIQDKGERITSQKKDDKNITINEEEVTSYPTGTHPEDMGEGVSRTKADRNERIYDVREAACPDNTPPGDMELVVGDEKNDKNDRLDDEKEAACLDDTTPDDMEVGVGDKKMTRMIDLMMKNRQHAHMTLLLMIWR